MSHVPSIAYAPAPARPSAIPVKTLISHIALECLKELAISLVLNGVVSCFVATPIGTSFVISAALTQFVVSLFFRTLGAWAASKGTESRFCQMAIGGNFAYFTGMNTQTLIHETGHALASLAIYKNPRPQIRIFPDHFLFTTGQTQYYKTAMTEFGKKLGPVASTFLIIASGPGLTLLVSSILLAVGVMIQKSHPQSSYYLKSWAYLDFGIHTLYALSALYADPSNLSHDFVHLSIFGLHPIAAAIGIAAIPLLVQIGAERLKKS